MDECPHCGEPLAKNARMCRYCGSDAETGWSPDVDYLSVELPDSYEEEAPAGLEAADDGDRSTLRRRRLISTAALLLGVFALIPSRLGEHTQMIGLALFVGGAYGLWSAIRAQPPADGPGERR